MVIRRCVQLGIVRLKCLALETGALNDGNAGLQEFARYPQNGIGRHAHQRGTNPLKFPHMRSDGELLQAARQSGGSTGAAHDHPRQPKFTFVDQGLGTCKTQMPQTDHRYL